MATLLPAEGQGPIHWEEMASIKELNTCPRIHEAKTIRMRATETTAEDFNIPLQRTDKEAGQQQGGGSLQASEPPEQTGQNSIVAGSLADRSVCLGHLGIIRSTVFSKNKNHYLIFI